jgi:cobalt-zinc-cadmium efflux system outer membrane protein
MYRREKWNYKRQLCAVAAFSVCSVINVFAQNTNQPRQIQSVKDIFDATWLRQPEAQALEARQQALQAQKRAAELNSQNLISGTEIWGHGRNKSQSQFRCGYLANEAKALRLQKLKPTL